MIKKNVTVVEAKYDYAKRKIRLAKKKKKEKYDYVTFLDVMLDYLSDNDYHTLQELSEYLNRNKNYIAGLVHTARNKYLNGTLDEYIHSTAKGYTLNPKPEDLTVEARRRWKAGTSTIINGAPIYKQLKQLSFKRFETLSIEYKPQFIKMNNLLKG